MGKAVLLSSAYGWFAGLLIVMIIVTALFAFILWIALKPVKKDELDTSSSTKKALARRETELTMALLELLNKEHDASKRAELEGKLREVKSAERLVNELMGEDEPVAKPAKPAKAPKAEPAAKPAKPAKPAKAPKAESAAKPAEAPKAEPAAKPAEAPKAEPAAKPAKPAKAPKAEAAAKPAKPAKPVKPAPENAEAVKEAAAADAEKKD